MKEIESWQNDKFIPNSEIGIKVWDSHFFFGHAVFDAFRTYNHIPHMLNCHIDRFYRSAELASINVPMEKNEMIQTIHYIMEHNKEFFSKDEEYRFMMFCSSGTFGIYKDIAKTGPTLTIDVTTVSRYADHVAPYLEKGYTSLITQQPQIPSRFLDPKIKSCSRLHYAIADAEMSQYKDCHWPLLLDEHGFITESSGANFGFIKDGNICLPKDENILRGCTMKFVEEHILNGMDIIKDNWGPYDVVNADSAFFTSTFLGLVPCYEIIYRGKRYRIDKNKNIINEMMKKYGIVLGINVNNQWKDWYEKNRL